MSKLLVRVAVVMEQVSEDAKVRPTEREYEKGACATKLLVDRRDVCRSFPVFALAGHKEEEEEKWVGRRLYGHVHQI